MSTDPRDVVLLGAGGHARVLAEALGERGVRVRGFIAPSADGSRLGDVPWLGDDTTLGDLGAVLLVNGVGSTGSLDRRTALHAAGLAAGLEFATVVHPTAVVAPSAVLGAGAQVLSGAIVGPGARIGADAIVNTGAIVDHDSVVGEHSHIATAAALAGDVVVGRGAHIGLGARVLQGVRVGSSSVIGAGAVVLRDVPDATTVVGVPARPAHPEKRD